MEFEPYPDGIKISINTWVSVKDRLPKEGVDVLVYCINTGLSFYPYGDRHCALDTLIVWKNGSTAFRTEFLGYGEVTYWMPLPEPPQ